MKAGKRFPSPEERERIARESMIHGTIGGYSKIGMPVVEVQRIPIPPEEPAAEITCPSLVGSAPVNGGGSTCFSRAINVAQDELLAVRSAATSGVYRFAWPGLTFIGNLYTYGATNAIDVCVSPAGDVFVATIVGTAVTLEKNGSTLASWTRTAAGGGGVCFASGYVWLILSSSSGGELLRVDPTSGADTTIASSGTDYSSTPTPASDGAVWWSQGTTIFRHLSGSTTSTTSGDHGTFRVPRYDGEIKVYDTGTGNWEQWGPGPASVALDCDPEAEGFSGAPVSTFYDPALEVVGMQDGFDQVYAYV